MNSFENVCDDCPLHTKVNLAYAGESTSMGSDGVHTELNDGDHSYKVCLSPYEVLDSNQALSAQERAATSINKCHGPNTGVLRKKCAVGLASSWRWVEAGHTDQVADSLETIKASIQSSTAKEAYQSTLREATWTVGSYEDYVGLPTGSPYGRCGYFRLANKVQGTHINLAKRRVMALDYAQQSDALKNIFRLHCFGGPSFHFIYENDIDEDSSIADCVAFGVEKFLSAGSEELAQSKEYAEAVYDEYERRREEMRKPLDIDLLTRMIKKSRKNNW